LLTRITAAAAAVAAAACRRNCAPSQPARSAACLLLKSGQTSGAVQCHLPTLLRCICSMLACTITAQSSFSCAAAAAVVDRVQSRRNGPPSLRARSAACVRLKSGQTSGVVQCHLPTLLRCICSMLAFRITAQSFFSCAAAAAVVSVLGRVQSRRNGPPSLRARSAACPRLRSGQTAAKASANYFCSLLTRITAAAAAVAAAACRRNGPPSLRARSAACLLLRSGQTSGVGLMAADALERHRQRRRTKFR
jgi:hypothetical protein